MTTDINVWDLPFGEPAELELYSEWGSVTIAAVEAGRPARLELTRGSLDNVAVHVEKLGETVRVALDPRRSGGWFGGSWECRATLYVPRDVRAHVQTSSGNVSVHDLAACELGVKASAGKIELTDVYGVIHLSADAGTISGHNVGGFFDVQTHAGSVRLAIADLQPGEHRIRASLGSIRVELARGLDVCVSTHTSLGSVRNSYPSHEAAQTKLVITSEMGSLRVSEGSLQATPRTASASAPSETGAAERADRPPAAPRADPELERILKMVEAGNLSAHDADDLLRAMGRV